MWKVVIHQKYEYSYIDGTKSIGTHESEYKFKTFVLAMNFIECAINNGTEKTFEEIEFVEGE